MDIEDREALRRRLYRPGASESDRLRYVGTLEAAEPGAGAQAAVARRHPRPPRGLVPGLVGVVAVVLALLVGRAAVPLPAAVPAPAAAQAERVVLPSQGVGMVVDGVATTGLRVEGNGGREVPLDVHDASFEGGRLTVLLSSSDARPVGWTARALETRRDWTSYRKAVATSPARDRQGAARAERLTYAGAPPRWIDVQAPADTVWTLTIAFTAGADPTLH